MELTTRGKKRSLDVDDETPASQRHGHAIDRLQINGNGNIVHVGNHFEGSVRDSAQSLEEYDVQQYEKLAKSLRFDRFNFRVNNVKKASQSTGDWLFEHPAFLKWWTHDPKEHNGFLWIKGKPGCGKSTLMKKAFEWAEKRRPKSRPKVDYIATPYFFNARASASLEKSPLGLYRTVVHQVLAKCPPLRTLFMEKFTFKDTDSEIDIWTADELHDFLSDCILSGTEFRLLLFIDALDEAEVQTDMQDMVSSLIQLADRGTASDSLCKLQICLSSRHFPAVVISRSIPLVVEDVLEHDRDIEMYIKRELTGLDDLDREGIQQEIRTRSAHVFLWVVLVVKIINRLTVQGMCSSQMKAHLRTIPSGLHELFRDILDRHKQESESSLILFRWMIFRLQPLGPADLYVAMLLSHHVNDLASDDPDLTVPGTKRLETYINHHSRGLVEIIAADASQPAVVQFIHETVREFLLSKDGLMAISENASQDMTGSSHDILRMACQRRVLMHDVPSDYVRNHRKSHTNETLKELKASMRANYPFLEYAVLHLFAHAEEAHQHNVAQAAFLGNLTKADGCCTDRVRQWWNLLQRYSTTTIGQTETLIKFLFRQDLPGIWSASADFGGVSSSRKEWLDDWLCDAAKFGLVKMTGQLLILGANANAKKVVRMDVETMAIHAAARAGKTEVIGILIRHGADIQMRVKHRTPLDEAVKAGKVGATEMLIRAYTSSSTHIDLPNGTLHTVMRSPNATEIVKLSIDLGADVNARFDGKLPLEAAVTSHKRGRVKAIVRLLVNAGANVNAETGGQRVLQLAAQHSGHSHNDEVVELLLAAGADVNPQGGDYGNALQAATTKSFARSAQEVIEILLRAGADVNAQGGHYGNALQAAAACSYSEHAKEVVEILLRAGADVNAQGGHYGNALQAAADATYSYKEHAKEVVEILLRAGADVNAQGGHYGNALQAATTCSYKQHAKEVIKILLRAGADVNAQGGHYGNALQAAAAWPVTEHAKEVVEILLRAGADINAHGGQYGNALQAAASNARHKCAKDVVELLLQAGADVNMVGGKYGGVMQAVVSSWDSFIGVDEQMQHKNSVLKLLLDAHADINLQAGEYGTVLQTAIARIAFGIDSQESDTLKVVTFLLDNGADINARGGKYGTALKAARSRGFEEIAKVLIARGAWDE